METSGAQPSGSPEMLNSAHLSPPAEDGNDEELQRHSGRSTGTAAENSSPSAGGATPPTGFHVGGVEHMFRTHTCPTCQRCFKMRSHLQEHLHLHFPDPSLQCPTCKHYFTSKSKLRVHRLREAGIKVHHCHLCKYSAVERNAVRRHLISVHADAAEEDVQGCTYPCPTCGQSFRQSRSLKAHMKTHTVLPGNTLSTCIQEGCSFQSPLRKTLLQHAANVHQIAAVECRHHSCGAIFTSNTNMELHYQTHMAYHCSQCDFCSSNKSVFLRHQRSGHPGANRFTCGFCRFETFNPVEFEQHVGHLHANEKIHSCPQCTYVTSHKQGLKRHLRTHSGEKPYKCSVCDFRCRDESYLSKHMLIHSEDKNFMCAECGYVTKWKHYLNVHMRKHTRDFRYQCDKCSYRCHRMDQLKSHKLRHQAKSLMCEICAYACKRKYELQNHMLTKHSGSAKQPSVYKCKYCTYTTCYRQALQNHENCKHTQQKEFRCALCAYSSFSSISLFLHKRKVHGYNPGDSAWLHNYTERERERDSPQSGLYETPSTAEGQFTEDILTAPRQTCDERLDSAGLSGGEPTPGLKAVDSVRDVEGVPQQAVHGGVPWMNHVEEYCTLILTTPTAERHHPPLHEQDHTCPDSPLRTWSGCDTSQVKAHVSSPARSGEDHDGPEVQECGQSDVDDTCEPPMDTKEPGTTPDIEKEAEMSSCTFPSEQNQLSEPAVHLKPMKNHDRDQVEVMVLDGRVQMLMVPSEQVHESDCYATSKDTALKNHGTSACDHRTKGQRCQSCDAQFKDKPDFDHQVAKRSPASQQETRKTGPGDKASVGQQHKRLEDGTRSHLSQDQKFNRHVECRSAPTTSQTLLSGSLKSSTFEHQHSGIQTKTLLKSNLVPSRSAHRSASLQKASLYVRTNSLFKCKRCGFTSVKLATVKRHLITCSKRANQKMDLDEESAKEKLDLTKEKHKHTAFKKHKVFSGQSCPLKSNQERVSDSCEKTGRVDFQCWMSSFGAKCQMSLTQHTLSTHQNKKNGIAPPAHLHRQHCKDRCRRQHVTLKRRGEKPHRCQYCPFSTRRRYRLEEHETLHTGTGRHRCSTCDKTFGNVTKLWQHKRRVHDKQPSHFCSLCDYSGYTLDDVRRHNLRCHTGELHHTCTHCQAAFSSKVALRNHCKRVHQLQVGFSCELCDYTCGSMVTLKMHQQCKHPPLKCTTCQETFDTRQHLEVHQRSHLLHRCQVCTFAAKTRSMLAQHLLNEHEEGPSENKPLKCSSCTFTCLHPLVLEQHLRSHGGKRLYKCTECKYSTRNKQKMTWHIRIHTGEKPYSCEQCTYTCTDPSRLKLHLRVHQDEKKFLCPECGYKCKWATQLKYHMTKHTGEKPYACTECDYRTNRADALRAHSDTQHCNTRPYICEKCGKAFKTLFILKTHQQQHSDGRPYRCGLCHKTFRWPAGLRHHYLSHTNRRPFYCRHCSYRAKQKFQVVKHLQRHHPDMSVEQGVVKDSEGVSLTLKEALEGILDQRQAQVGSKE